MEFYDLNEVTLMNVGEHFTATDVEWDPSGRYVSTSVSWWAQKVRLQTLHQQELGISTPLYRENSLEQIELSSIKLV
jgi:uncharacterized protein with WD repeat